MGTKEVMFFIRNYMSQVFDDAVIELNIFYDIRTIQHKGILKISYRDFKESFDILFDAYHIEKQIVDFCNGVVCYVKQAYLDYLRKEK